jgi:hypothetical protein
MEGLKVVGIMPKNLGTVENCKVIILGDKNLAILKGYKAEVTKQLSVLPDSYPRHQSSVTITITGLSNKAAKLLEESLVPLPEEEVTEVLRKKGFTFPKTKEA